MSFKTVGNRVMVKLDEVGDKTESGLYMPQTAQDKPIKWGTVVSPGTQYVIGGGYAQPQTQAGQKVLIDSMGGTEAVVGGKTYVIVRNEDVIGVDVA